MKNFVEYERSDYLKKYQIRGYVNKKRYFRKMQEFQNDNEKETNTLLDKNFINMMRFRRTRRKEYEKNPIQFSKLDRERLIKIIN